MNTPTQITLSNSLAINQSANSQANELSQLPDEVLAAKNIQFSKDSITLDVFIDKHWQTLRLGTTSAPQNLQKIASANIQLSPDGKQLNISPNSTTLTLSQPVQLQRLLNYVSTGTEVQSQPMDVHVTASPSPKLVIDKLNASIAINKEVAQLLITEQPLKVVVSTTNKGAQINVVNRFADTVHSQPLSQTKLTNLLVALLPNAQLQATPKLAILTHPQKSGSFTTPITNQQLAELPNTPIKVNLVNQADKLFIKTDTNNIKVTLNNSFSKPFNELLLAQKSNAPAVPSSVSNVKVNPLLALDSPIKSWLQPIGAKLLNTLLKFPDTTIPAAQLTHNKQLLSSQITDVVNIVTKNTPDLTRLINQAFNRMVSSNNINPSTIQREILATLQPNQLTGDMLQSSFTKGLEQVAVSILAAPIINQSVAPISFNNQTGLDALLQVLIPTFKTGNIGAKMFEQLQQAQVQSLASEIVNAKNTLTQVTVTTPNQQPDTNPLAQFLLPMKLPPDVAQTEITLGQYKKPSADKLEDKNVWFVRLNFDYAQLGQLQITAELMDKALNCQLLASSQEVSAIAHPHLDNLRSKLAKHGLQVGELNLKRGDANNQAFYKSHAIINIKV